MTLADFNSAPVVSAGAYAPPRPLGGAARQPPAAGGYGSRSRPANDEDILLNLPRGPAGYDPDESSRGGLGGAFKEYGGNRG
eukprot:scaffold447008_cov17-Prasinocladus_malaysianus.AAC.1